MEVDEGRAREARDNFSRAGLAGSRQRHRRRRAAEDCPCLRPFDLIFQDGASKLYTPPLDCLVALFRPGGLLLTPTSSGSARSFPASRPCPRHDPDDTRAIMEYQPMPRRTSGAADEHRAAARRVVAISVKRSLENDIDLAASGHRRRGKARPAGIETDSSKLSPDPTRPSASPISTTTRAAVDDHHRTFGRRRGAASSPRSA